MKDNPKPFWVELPIKVRAYDIDALGHVNNIVYIRWMEDARMAMLEEYLPYESLMAEHVSPVLLHTEIDYLVPVKLFDPLICHAWIPKVKGVQMWIVFEFRVNESLRASGRQKAIFFDYQKEKPCKPPKRFMEQYQKYFSK